MYCPRCGEERSSDATSFCSRCGYLLTGTAELLKTGGALPSDEKAGGKASARSRGIRHGIFLIVLSVVVFPVFGLLFTFGLGMRNPWPAGVVLFLLFGAGLLRILYALMFEPKTAGSLRPAASGDMHLSSGLPGASTQQLNPSTIEPIISAASGWRSEDDLQPASVTEETTNLLERPPR